MNQVAVVIGGGQTLGEFLCRGLAAEGYRVAVVDIQSEKASRVARRLTLSMAKVWRTVSAPTPPASQRLAPWPSGWMRFFRASTCWCTAPGSPRRRLLATSRWGILTARCRSIWWAIFLCAREFSRLMIRDGIQGRIIQINSKSGKVGSKHNSGYSAAKFGGVGLTQSLALDLAEYGITVHSLMLGNLLKSPMFQSLLPQYATKLGIDESEVEQYYIDKVPLKRGCEYQDVLNVLMFYASPRRRTAPGSRSTSPAAR